MSTDNLTLIGLAAAVALVVLLVLRFGRRIARVLLIVGALAAVGLGSFVLLSQALANQVTARAALETARVARTATTGQTIVTVMVVLALGAMGVVTLGAIGFGGFWWVRWRLSERRLVQLPRRQPQRARAKALLEQPPQVVYIVRDPDDGVDLADVDLSQWGW
jgi:hypothetical protein